MLDTSTRPPAFCPPIFAHMSMYHCDFWRVLALFSPLGHGFRSFFFLEHLERTRRYITTRDRGSSDNRGASYHHRKPPKLALFCGVPIPGKLEQALAFSLFCGAFCTRPCVVCCKQRSNSDARSALHMSSGITKKPANEQSATSGVKAYV